MRKRRNISIQNTINKVSKINQKINEGANEYNKLVSISDDIESMYDELDNESEDSYPVAYGARCGIYNIALVNTAKEIFANEIFQYANIVPDIKWISVKEATFIYENMITKMGVKYIPIEEKELEVALCLREPTLSINELIYRAAYMLADINNKYSVYLATTILLTLYKENSIKIKIPTKELIDILNNVKYKSIVFSDYKSAIKNLEKRFGGK